MKGGKGSVGFFFPSNKHPNIHLDSNLHRYNWGKRGQSPSPKHPALKKIILKKMLYSWVLLEFSNAHFKKHNCSN